ncbi:MAG: rhomboid family intramembrane serine protease [Firmicutes bacterium]|nr:rhomboid family intramembrane serine protease [Bacillota bacterium]
METAKKTISRIRYNSPVILTYTLICIVALIANYFTDGQVMQNLFCARNQGIESIYTYSGLILHIFGHINYEHFFGNFTIILLVGPMLEEKYGSYRLLMMIMITAIITGLLHIIFFDTAILGASGIAFMFILLSSFTNYKKGEIPATFIIIIILFAGQEIADMVTKNDNVSQIAHLLGGTCGGLFGFILESRQNKIQDTEKNNDELKYNTDMEKDNDED